ncbi:MAG: ABC transporter ATP-binding protein [Rhodospirillales bacterium]|nr:MAG: ABC transporter ATP-binding protein [Rhodospirillales bacterium]
MSESLGSIYSHLVKSLDMLEGGERWLWAMLIVLSLFASGLESMAAVAVYGLVQILGNPQSAAGFPVVGPVLISISEGQPQQIIYIFAGSVMIFFMAKNLFLIFQKFTQENYAIRSTVRLADQLFRGYLHAPYDMHFHRNSAELVTNVDNGPDQVFRRVLLEAVSLISEALIVTGLLIVLFVSEPKVTLFTFGILGTVMALILKTTQKHFANWGHQTIQLLKNFLMSAQQSLGSLKVVKVLGREEFFLRQFHHIRLERGRIQRNYAVMTQAPRLLVETLLVVGMVMVVLILVGDQREQKDVLSVIGLFAYSGFRIMPSFSRIVMCLSNIRVGGQFVEVIHKDYVRYCQAPHHEARGQEGSLSHLDFRREIVLENVFYQYPGAESPALNGLSMTIPHGTTIGIAGASGSGKSTTIDLLLGLLNPQKGRITVDGQDIAASLRSWQGKIGYVPQEINLLDDSIAANIAFGVPLEQVDLGKLSEAIRLAQLVDVIGELPEGTATMIGERGVRLSGGQRQRLGVARALYHQPEVLVFDEATSSLDGKTEFEISQAIEGLKGQKTIILVAHRLSTLRNCSRLFFLQDGAVASQGTFTELTENNDKFRQLADLSSLQ